MVESKKRHNLVNILRNSLKSLSGHLNIDTKPYVKYENPSSISQDIVLTIGWLVILGLTALLDNSSVYIGPSPKEMEKEEKG